MYLYLATLKLELICILMLFVTTVPHETNFKYVLTFQLENADEQAAAIRRELDARQEKISEMERVKMKFDTKFINFINPVASPNHRYLIYLNSSLGNSKSWRTGMVQAASSLTIECSQHLGECRNPTRTSHKPFKH